jgi:hypothetical protein
MACGLAHKESAPQKFRDAVACGQKFENPHFQHYCMVCGNRGSEVCEKECFYGSTCHFTQEDPKQVRETVEAVLVAIQDIRDDMEARTRETAKVAALTVPRLEGEMMG